MNSNTVREFGRQYESENTKRKENEETKKREANPKR